jgi:hypothetical protein
MENKSSLPVIRVCRYCNFWSQLKSNPSTGFCKNANSAINRMLMEESSTCDEFRILKVEIKK